MRIREEEFETCKTEIMAWETYCWKQLKNGLPIPFDPFYPRNAVLTADIVEVVIKTHEANLQYEIDNFPLSHAEWQGLIPGGKITSRPNKGSDEWNRYKAMLAPTRWDKLPYNQQFAIVQGLDRVYDKHRMTGEDFESERQKKQRDEEIRHANLVVRAENLARDPHYYDSEYYDYGC